MVAVPFLVTRLFRLFQVLEGLVMPLAARLAGVLSASALVLAVPAARRPLPSEEEAAAQGRSQPLPGAPEG